MAVAAGYDHSGVLLEDGQGWSWGMNEMSQLGRERWGRYTECPPDKGTPQGGRAPSLEMGTEQPMAAADRRLTELHPMQAEASPSRLLRPFAQRVEDVYSFCDGSTWMMRHLGESSFDAIGDIIKAKSCNGSLSQDDPLCLPADPHLKPTWPHCSARKRSYSSDVMP